MPTFSFSDEWRYRTHTYILFLILLSDQQIQQALLNSLSENANQGSAAVYGLFPEFEFEKRGKKIDTSLELSCGGLRQSVGLGKCMRALISLQRTSPLQFLVQQKQVLYRYVQCSFAYFYFYFDIHSNDLMTFFILQHNEKPQIERVYQVQLLKMAQKITPQLPFKVLDMP